MDHKDPNRRTQITTERKALYYLGMALTVGGILLFVSTFFVIARGPSMPFDYNPFPQFLGRGLGGMALMVIGRLLIRVGARGVAGSGLVLDPHRARKDLEPWARTAGGLVKDALDEVKSPPAGGGSGTGTAGGTPPKDPEATATVKVRCPQCRTLNDEDAAFCKSCGASL